MASGGSPDSRLKTHLTRELQDSRLTSQIRLKTQDSRLVSGVKPSGARQARSDPHHVTVVETTARGPLAPLASCVWLIQSVAVHSLHCIYLRN